MKNILLVHGWDYDNYYGRTTKEAWNNREKFISELSKNYHVFPIDLPGFGNNPPPGAKMWTLDDFAIYIEEYIKDKKLAIDYLLGYSFGGAVSIRWKTKFKHHAKLLLISPAIVRNFENSHSFLKTPEFLEPIRNSLRNFYLIHIIKNPEMKYGTKFHQNTYQSIVRLDLTKEVESIPKEELAIIYGDVDNMVNPNKLQETIDEKYKERIILIKGGGHDIANTHTEKLIEEIKKF